MSCAEPSAPASGLLLALVGGGRLREDFGGGAAATGSGCTRDQFSPPHRKPRKQPCTLSVLGSSRLILAE